MGWEKFEKGVERGPLSAAWTIGVPLAIVIVVIGMCGFGWNLFVQPARIFNKTIDADNVIYNYEWFKERHEKVLAIDKQISNAYDAVVRFEEGAGERKSWHRDDRIEHARP